MWNFKGALSRYSVFFFVDFLRSKMAARRLEPAAPANEKQAFAAPQINLQLSWSNDRSRLAIFQVHFCIPLHSTMCTTIIDRRAGHLLSAPFGKMHGRHYFSPQQNGAKNH